MTGAERQKIREEVAAREITRLCHFTQSRKLPHVLSAPSGILSRAELERLHPDLLDANDDMRLDGKENINCSIEYPNSWMLRRVQEKAGPLFKDWVVLLIHPRYLWEPTTRFCPCNAAAGYGRYICDGLDGFRSLFLQEVNAQRRYIRLSSMLRCCPTDGQAEVLVRGPILREHIMGVIVKTPEQAMLEMERLSLVPQAVRVPWYVAPDVLSSVWHGMICSGRRPAEALVR